MSDERALLAKQGDRLIRLETILFKLCLFLGMNPRTGLAVKDSPYKEDRPRDG